MSNKKLAIIERDISVGIWDNLTEVVSVYADRTVVKSWCVKWSNNNGSLTKTAERIVGVQHAKILAALENAKSDEVDPDDYVLEVIRQYAY